MRTKQKICIFADDTKLLSVNLKTDGEKFLHPKDNTFWLFFGSWWLWRLSCEVYLKQRSIDFWISRNMDWYKNCHRGKKRSAGLRRYRNRYKGTKWTPSASISYAFIHTHKASTKRPTWSLITVEQFLVSLPSWKQMFLLLFQLDISHDTTLVSAAALGWKGKDSQLIGNYAIYS